MGYDPTSQPDPTRPSPEPPSGPGCWLVGLSMLLVFALVASSLGALFWFLGRDVAESAVAPPTLAPTAVVVEALPDAANPTPETAAATAEIVPTAPADPNAVNRIVLVNQNGQLETIDPFGTERRMLTNSRARAYQFPTWSPDSQTIAAIGSSTAGGGIYLLDDETDSTPREVVFSERSAAPFYLYWSPDGSKISYLANDPSEGIGLNLVDAQPDGMQSLIATGSPFYWNWTNDSRQLLIHSGSRSNEARLAMIDESGENIGSAVAAPGLFQAPGISADGRYWAYSQFGDGGSSWLVVEDRETSERIEQRHGALAALSWSPTANQVAFISGASEELSFWGPLRVLDVATGEMKQLSAETVLAFFWSPDGQQIAYISVPALNGFDSMEASLFDAKTQRLSRGAAQQSFELSLSVVDVATGQGLRLAGFTPSPLFLRQFMPFFDQYALSHSIWSPNSDAVVLPIILNGEDRVVAVFPTNGGRMREVGLGDAAFWSRR